MEKYLEAGRIVNTHGVKGSIKLDVWCNSAEDAAMIKKFYFRRGVEYIPVKVEEVSIFKKMLILKLEGINTFEEAVKLKNIIVYADRDDIKINDGDYFIADLKGLSVVDVDSGKIYGVLNDVISSGAQPLYEIKSSENNIYYMPAVEQFVIDIDLEKGIFVRPIEGMFDAI